MKQEHLALSTDSQVVSCPLCDTLHQVEMESISCNLCGERNEEELFYRGDLWLGLSGKFRMVRCKTCALIYMNPRPTLQAIGYYYPSSYLLYHMPHLDRNLPPLVRWEETRRLNKRAKVVTTHKKSGRLLDIGCASGQFLNQMRSWGNWDLAGLELSPTAAQEARERYNLAVTTGRFQEIDFEDNYFDVVTLWDVVEHLHNPVNDLCRVAQILKPDGVVVLRIPTIDSLGAKLFGQYWIGYELPRHLYIFSRQTIKRILAKAGLQIKTEYVLYGSDFTFAESIRFFLRGKGRSPLLYNGLFRIMYSWPARWLVLPVFKLFDRLKLTTMMTIVATKQGPRQ